MVFKPYLLHITNFLISHSLIVHKGLAIISKFIFNFCEKNLLFPLCLHTYITKTGTIQMNKIKVVSEMFLALACLFYS